MCLDQHLSQSISSVSLKGKHSRTCVPRPVCAPLFSRRPTDPRNPAVAAVRKKTKMMSFYVNMQSYFINL